MKSQLLHLKAADFFERGLPFAAMRIRTDAVSPLWHDHDFFEMVFVLRGTGVHKTLARKTPLRRGSVFFMNRGEPHSFETTGLLENLTLLLSPKLFSEAPLRELIARQPQFLLPRFVEGKTGGFHTLALTLPQLAAIHPLLESILSEYLAKRQEHPTVIACDLAKLLILLGRCGGRETGIVPDSHAARVMDYVRQHFHEDITLDSLAEGLDLSAAYLSRLFPKKTGFRVMEYVKDVRIQKATELLKHSDHPVVQVAQETGFGGLSAFYEAFKKATGISPTALRKAHG
ncbi:MAG: helix-turn-helix domain-containing protein [Spirochaetes bacterium]|nr:helix-turn-helix domain-containing protein [Spirochaetota bacterium]